MLDGHKDRIRLAYSLSFSLPGAQVLFYGEEIGMAENLDIEGRMAVRSPMQWSRERNGGFSTAPPEQLRRPLTPGRKWGPQGVNVADQQRDPDSMLNWMERLVRVRRETPEIALGDWSVLPAADAELLALRYDWGKRTVFLAHNLGAKARRLTFNVDPQTVSGLSDMFASGDCAIGKDGAVTIDIEGYGYRWLRARRPSGGA